MKRRILGICFLIFAIASLCFCVGCGECEHIYDNDCDTDCNECGSSRSVDGHVYSFACDKECNVCSYIREAQAHAYSGGCDERCNVCMEQREPETEHGFSADCDAKCETCGLTRTATGEHTYANDCDTDCNFCGVTREAEEHVYDDDCDTRCNECDAERTVNNHTYKTECATECTVCDFKRVSSVFHAYSGDCDEFCNSCEEQRTADPDHGYASDCDLECDVCGVTRVATGEHSYENDCQPSCSLCGEERTGVEHEWTNDRVVSDADCTQNETRRRECDECGTVQEYEVEDSALGHRFDDTADYVYNNDATHTNDGTESQKCLFCEYKRNTRPALGTAGHSFDQNGKCSECDLRIPQLDDYVVFENFETYNKLDQSFSVTPENGKTQGSIKAETTKPGVKYAVISKWWLGSIDIRALKITRDASETETGNDAIVDVIPSGSATLSSKHVIEFDIMIGSNNAADIYFDGIKQISGSDAVSNRLVWYNDATESVLIGNIPLVSGIEDDQWFTVALAIDDEAKTYDIYVEGFMALSGIPYVNTNGYYSHSEVTLGCYRFAANEGTEAAEFYLDNVVVYNGNYRAR